VQQHGCVFYILMFSVDFVWVVYEVEWLYTTWLWYALPILAISRFSCVFAFTIPCVQTYMVAVQFCSTYLVLCAMFERFLLTANWRCFPWVYSRSGRKVTCLPISKLPSGYCICVQNTGLF
jgi:hypothetical protein